MPLTVWTQPSGYTFGTYNERQTVNISLPVLPIPTPITYKVISGKLPQGLRINGSSIIGTPFEVPRTTNYKFVIRASSSTEISDRTFNITIEGSDEPKWLTPAGLLPVGSNNAYYIIDSSFIDFNLVAKDTDTATGQELNFFIASGEGELPPGLILLPNGRITGFIQPLLAVPEVGDEGFYDSGLYDNIAYDFGYRSSNGYDSFVFDLVTYDFNTGTRKPKKLNRNYEFIATITDGDTITKRKFRIYVVGEDFFRSDNVIMEAGEGVYTADVSYVRAPIFTTPNYLGLRRASNYQTFKIDIFEGFYNELGPVIYQLCPGNAVINGLIQKETGTDNREGSINVRFIRSTGIPEIGYKFNFNQDFIGSTSKTYTVTGVDPLGGDFYRVTINEPLEYTIPDGAVIYLGPESRLPPGMQFDISSGEVLGVIPYQPAVTQNYTFTIKAMRFGDKGEISSSRRMFTVDVLGEVESAITWLTNSNLGTIDVGYPSILFVKALTSYSQAPVFYTIEKGKLPPGLNLNLDGELVGAVNQLRDRNTYKGFWKTLTNYSKKNIVKIDNQIGIRSVSRRKNITTVVTNGIHKFKNNDIVKVNSTVPTANYYTGIEIAIDTIKLNSVVNIQGTGPYRVKFIIPEQKNALLAPILTLIKGTSKFVNDFLERIVEVKSTSGNGTGARFLVSKANNSTLNYNGVTTIIVVDAGTGYLPGDTVTISGADLNGDDGVNDLTFTLFNGIDFLYKINGNSNSNYNGNFNASSSKQKDKIILGSPILVTNATSVQNLATATTSTAHNLTTGDLVEIKNINPVGYNGTYEVTVLNSTEFTYTTRNFNLANLTGTGFAQKIKFEDTVTLLFENNPGIFGTGLISATTGLTTYEAQTQLTPLNYFNYSNPNSSLNMKKSGGTAIGQPFYYRCTENHSSSIFNNDLLTKWELYKFPENEKTPFTLDSDNTFFDDEDTSIDRVYKFTIKARDPLGYSAVTRDFILRINIPGNTYYSNIKAKPFLKVNQRQTFKEFINDVTIFDPQYIYRLGDPNFGIQKNLETLVFAGIETKEAVKYISAMGVNHKPKRFKMGGLKTALANMPGTRTPVYEVVYIELLDPLERNKRYLPFRISHIPSSLNVTSDNNNDFYDGPFNIDSQHWGRPIPFYSSIDRTDIIAGDSGTGVKFPSSISIWRKRIKNIEAKRDRNYLPLWMRSIQPESYVELDFVPAVPLCYCLPGLGKEIILNIKNSGFDFKLLDYTIDRYIIDAVEGYYEDKYLVFRNDRTTIV